MLQALQPHTGLEAFHALESMFEWLQAYSNQQKTAGNGDQSSPAGQDSLIRNSDTSFGLSAPGSPTTPQSPEQPVWALPLPHPLTNLPIPTFLQILQIPRSVSSLQHQTASFASHSNKEDF